MMKFFCILIGASIATFGICGTIWFIGFWMDYCVHKDLGFAIFIAPILFVWIVIVSTFKIDIEKDNEVGIIK